MKNTPRFLLFVLTMSVILLSACSGTPSSPAGDDSNAKGSSATPVVLDDNGNSSNSNDANSNDNNGSDGSSNDSAVEIIGVVEAITDDTVTIAGVTYQLASSTEFKDLVAVGDQVKIHFVVNADGTFTILEVEISSGLDGANGNDNNSNDTNSNDDNSNDANSNDDNGNANSNDANSNDDNGNDGNSNDDSGNANSNDDNGGGNSNDDNGGGGNDNGGGDDDGSNDNGGGSNDNG